MGSKGTDAAEIPVINLTPSNADAPSQLLDAAATYGFVFIENDETVVSSQDIDRMFDLSKVFFAAPMGVKEEVSISSNKAGKNHGWLSRGVEKLDPATQKRPDVKEAFNMGNPINGQLQQPLPKPLQPHEQTIIDFQNACHELCQHILQNFATALKIDKDWFTSRHDHSKGPSGTVFRLLYYPQVHDADTDEADIRAGAHSDYGSITLLFQQLGQPGLEIKTPSGEWAAVPVDPKAGDRSTANSNGQGRRPLPILVNIGDLLEDWTGGLLKSTVHRVIFPKEGGGDRYSMAYFCHPLDDAVLEPVPSKLVEAHVQRADKVDGRNGRVITARDHLMERLAATYKVK